MIRSYKISYFIHGIIALFRVFEWFSGMVWKHNLYINMMAFSTLIIQIPTFCFHPIPVFLELYLPIC